MSTLFAAGEQQRLLIVGLRRLTIEEQILLEYYAMDRAHGNLVDPCQLWSSKPLVVALAAVAAAPASAAPRLAALVVDGARAGSVPGMG